MVVSASLARLRQLRCWGVSVRSYLFQVVVGVVFNPITDELFTAVRGRGAFLNEATRLAVSEEDDPGSALLITEIGVGRDAATVEALFDRMANLTTAVRAIRVREHGAWAPSCTENASWRGLTGAALLHGICYGRVAGQATS